jgi:hypothetical protein
MTDRDAVIDTINRLFIATDNRDWETVRALFAPSVLFDMTSLAGGAPAPLTPSEITEGWQTGLAGIDHIHHQSGNFLVDISGNEATAFCYGVAYHHRDKSVRIFVGSYDVHLVRGDRWRIDRFKFNVKFVEPPL